MNKIISINLAGKHVLVVGGEHNCEVTLLLLKSASANVTLVAPLSKLSKNVISLVQSLSKSLVHIDKEFEVTDLESSNNSINFGKLYLIVSCSSEATKSRFEILKAETM
jgi:siroheme synthase (precorrin-2 oxidase/ferrochelatase)